MTNRRTRLQQTITKPVRVSGQGYWSGQRVTLEFRPAAVDSGIQFVRRDLPGMPRVAARVAYRTEVPRRTVLVNGSARVDMVEHVLAALAGLQIDNCEIWASAEEMPACDGSSAAYVAALTGTGVLKQNRPIACLTVAHPVRVGDDQSWVEARPGGGNAFELHYDLDYGSDNRIGRQSLSLKLTPHTFRYELAPARTFVLQEEAVMLREQQLGMHIGYQDLLVFGEAGPVQNSLRFPDECVRHKMLDMVGDLALSGYELVGQFHAYRSGHALNAQLVRELLAAQRALVAA